MAKERTPKGTSDESIGRPAEWREGRYEQPGKPLEEGVTRSEKDNPPDPGSDPVTRKDYEDGAQKPGGGRN